jgi:hypothetical protein
VLPNPHHPNAIYLSSRRPVPTSNIQDRMPGQARPGQAAANQSMIHGISSITKPPRHHLNTPEWTSTIHIQLGPMVCFFNSSSSAQLRTFSSSRQSCAHTPYSDPPYYHYRIAQCPPSLSLPRCLTQPPGISGQTFP